MTYTVSVWNPAGAGKRFVECAVPGYCQAVGVQHQSCVQAAPGLWRWEAVLDLPAGLSTWTLAASSAAAAPAIPKPPITSLEILADLLMPGGHYDLRVLHGGTELMWQLQQAKVLSWSGIRSIVRIPTVPANGVAAWLDLEYIPALPGSTPFRLWLTAAPWDGTPYCHTLAMALETRGAVYPVFSHARRKGLGYQQVGETVTVPLLPGLRWGRGQGQIYHGHLVYGSEAAAWAPHQLATGTGAVLGVRCHELAILPDGTTGQIPTPAQVAGWQAANRQGAKVYAGKPWSPPLPLGLGAAPGGTGNQPDFGDSRLWPADLMLYDADLVQECVSQEYCRPCWHLEQDRMTPVRAAKHPAWKSWDWTTHWHAEISTDRLGAGDGAFGIGDSTGQLWPWDEEHGSFNHLVEHALVTGKPWAIEMLDRLSEGFLASVRNYNPRAQGRVLYSVGRWNRILQRADVAAVIADRIERQPRFRPAVVGGPYPLGLIGPDPRNLDVTQWLPWWDGLGIAGMSIHAPGWLYEIAVAWLKWGWRPRVSNPGGRLEILKAVAWNNGVPLTDVEYQQIKSHGPGALAEETGSAWDGDRFVGDLLEEAPTNEIAPAAGVALVEESDGTAFGEWTLTATRYLLREATKRGDDATRDRAALIVQQHGEGATIDGMGWRQVWRR